MNQENPASKDSKSNKWLVRILLIVGIGVPVLIEVFTFSGLVSSHIFGEGEKEPEHTSSAAPDKERLPHINQGDTLFTDTDYPLEVKTLRLEIFPNQWVFSMELQIPQITSLKKEDTVELIFTRLETQQQSLDDNRTMYWSIASSQKAHLKWELSTGQRPQATRVIYRRIRADTAVDTLEIGRDYKFGHVPARYKQ